MSGAPIARFPAAAYTVRRHASLEEIGAEAWDQLADRSVAATVFQRWSWNRSWWTARADASHGLALMSVVREGRLVALAPLHLGDPSVPRGQALSFIGQGNSDYQDFLVDRDEPGALDALLAAVRAPSLPWRRFLLYELPEGSLLRARLESDPGDGSRRLERRPDTPCPRFDIVRDRAGFARLPDKQAFKRHAARLARGGTVTVSHLADADAIRAELPAFYRQHVERWSVTATPSLFHDPTARTFYEELTRHGAPRGEVLLTVLRLDGRPVAYHFGFIWGGRLVWYKPSFDLRLFREGPGTVLLQAMIRRAAAWGFSELDFTRGDEAYKARYSNDVRRNANWIWYRDAAIERRNTTREALRAPLRIVLDRARVHTLFGSTVETFASARRERSGAGAALGAALSNLLEAARRPRFATCAVPARSPGGTIEEAGVDALLGESPLEPGSPRAAIAAEGYRRLRAGARGLVVSRDGEPAAVAWLDGAGRIDRVDPLGDRLDDADLRDLARAASRDGRVRIRLRGRVDAAALRRAGLAVESVAAAAVEAAPEAAGEPAS